jgi:hypothetical protein
MMPESGLNWENYSSNLGYLSAVSTPVLGLLLGWMRRIMLALLVKNTKPNHGWASQQDRHKHCLLGFSSYFSSVVSSSGIS